MSYSSREHIFCREIIEILFLFWTLGIETSTLLVIAKRNIELVEWQGYCERIKKLLCRNLEHKRFTLHHLIHQKVEWRVVVWP